MLLKFVNANVPAGEALQPIPEAGQLGASGDLALRALFGERAERTEALRSSESTPQEGNDASAMAQVQLRRDALAVLRRAKAEDLWIACDCRPDAVQAPLMCAVFMKEHQTYSFKRMTGKRTLHGGSCCFRFTPEEAAAKKKTAARSLNPLADRTPLFIAPAMDDEKIAKHHSPGAAPPAGENYDDEEVRPKLAKILFKLLERSHLNRYFAGTDSSNGKPKYTLNEQYANLRGAAKGLFLARGLPLPELFWTFPGALKDRAVNALRNKNNHWPSGVRPQGFLVTVAENVGEKLLLFKGEAPDRPLAIEVDGVMRAFARKNSTKAPPYLIIANFGESAVHPGEFRVLSAYAHPVFSKSRLIPMDSDYERETFKSLCQVGDDLYRKSRAQIMIDKPVHNIEVELDGECLPCRPDFLVRWLDAQDQEQCLVIETMGFDDADYLADKFVMHRRMAAVGQVVKHEMWRTARGMPIKELNQHFERRIYAIVSGSLQNEYFHA